MQALTARYPSLSLRPREAIAPKLLRDLQDGRLFDAALVALPVSRNPPWPKPPV